ncbi:methyltransferase domain-containing protein [Actinokineospora auranticolor]|uniref:Methyltransferase family protein n=1 Tax=Actinokineospora auranticolor TaxID=155976 RepID=A0A2S6GJJ1_9PSEU|nr:methyltransferase domain-containing protein [Actinokineospora auranticolor]PPK65402.1 methyltransferase family protein [Actinokineospora auranticolor]
MSTLSPDPVDYLDRTAASSVGRAYKRHLLDLLDPGPGETALDIGCGPGTDLAAVAERVTPAGSVIGVDRDPAMVAEARRRHPACLGVDVRKGDALALPVADGSVDRARVDRVLHQVTDPARALAEVRRVLRPGAVAVLAQPDYTTLTVDPGDWRTVRTVIDHACANAITHPDVGRRLPRLARAAGLTVEEVTATAPMFDDLEEADLVLGLTRLTARAVAAAALAPERAGDWLAELRTGPFLAVMTLFVLRVRA